MQEEVSILSAKMLQEKKESNHPADYAAPEGSKRDKQLDQTKADLES
jgi:hypothetical protein